VSEDLLPWERLDLREFVLGVVGVHGENLLTGWGTEDFDDLDQLVDTALSWEDGLAEHELSDDAADGPDINVSAILGVSEDQLWCTVVP